MGARRTLAILLGALMCSGVLSLIPSEARASFSLVTYMSGLNWPGAIAFSPDGRIFFEERLTGQVRIIENNVLLPTPFYTLRNLSTVGEQGLLGLALDPGFPTAPWVYVYYTFIEAGTTYNRIARIHALGNGGDSYEVILDHIPANTYHNGGVIAFAPDGTLFAVVGENGYPDRAQDLLSLNGKVLRMNPNGTVPTDNPFVGNASANPYVYTYGHRNMFGLTFHNATGRPYATENGPACNDEVNLLLPGRNYGWGPNETCTTPPPPPGNTNQDGPNPVFPMVWYTPTIAPTNAIIYNGRNFSAWQGDLIFGDWNTRNLRRLDLVPPNYDTVVSQEVILTAPSNIVDVEVGPDGAIWFTTPDTIYRVVDTSAPPRPPVASFAASPTRVNPNQPVTFDASASYDPDGTIARYDWDFGDGFTGAGKVVTHGYASPGAYTVALTVVDNGGFTANATGPISVNAPPGAAFTVSPSVLRVAMAATFNATGSRDPDGTITSYSWDFDDGSTGGGSVTTHAFAGSGTYVVTLTVMDNELASGTATKPVRVNAGPRASILATPSFSFIGVEVRFDGRGSTDADGAIASFAWTFGDLGAATGPLVTHTYTSKGQFAVALTVTDNDGATDRGATTITVGNRPPTITSATPSGDTILLEQNASQTLSVAAGDLDGDAISFTWRLNGAVVGAGPTLDFHAAAAGVYLVSVTVSDGALDAVHQWTIIVAQRFERPPLGAGLVPGWPFVAIPTVMALAAFLFLVLPRLARRKPPVGPPGDPR